MDGSARSLGMAPDPPGLLASQHPRWVVAGGAARRDAVGFFNALLDDSHRFSASSQVEERRKELRHEDGSRELLFSYLM